MKTQFCIALLILTTFSGCGNGRPGLVEATGKVTVNGEAVEGATVIFQMIDPPEGYGRPSTARTNAAGEFTVGTYGAGDGIPTGKYKVGILKKEPMSKSSENANPEDPASARRMKYEWTTPMEAADPETSGLVTEVTSSGMEPSLFALEGGGEVEVSGQDRNVP